jgi:hypothetical protein
MMKVVDQTDIVVAEEDWPAALSLTLAAISCIKIPAWRLKLH